MKRLIILILTTLIATLSASTSFYTQNYDTPKFHTNSTFFKGNDDHLHQEVKNTVIEQLNLQDSHAKPRFKIHILLDSKDNVTKLYVYLRPLRSSIHGGYIWVVTYLNNAGKAVKYYALQKKIVKGARGGAISGAELVRSLTKEEAAMRNEVPTILFKNNGKRTKCVGVTIIPIGTYHSHGIAGLTPSKNDIDLTKALVTAARNNVFGDQLGNSYVFHNIHRTRKYRVLKYNHTRKLGLPAPKDKDVFRIYK
jgi:hypothetical protein